MRRILVVMAFVLAGIMLISVYGFSDGYGWWHLIGLICSLLLLGVAAIWPASGKPRGPAP